MSEYQDFLASIDRVFNKLKALPKEEFLREIEGHEDGDFATILMETNALEVAAYKSQVFEYDTLWMSLAEPLSASTARVAVGEGGSYSRLEISSPPFSINSRDGEASKVLVGGGEESEWLLAA